MDVDSHRDENSGGFDPAAVPAKMAIMIAISRAGSAEEVQEALASSGTHGRTPSDPMSDVVDAVAEARLTALGELEVEREGRQRAERDEGLAETLYDVGQAIARRRDLHEIVQLVTDACTELSTAQFGAFFYNVLEESGGQMLLYTLSGAPRSAFEQYPIPRPTKIFEPTFHGTHVMRLDDVTQHPDFGQNAPYHGMPKGHLPVRSYLAVPVILPDDTVAGGMFFGHSDVGIFTEGHERLVQGVASHAAIAIESVRLLDSERWARRQAEERAQAALSLQHIAEGVFLVDTDGVVRTWNPAASQITGVAQEAAIGRPIAEMLHDWEIVAAQIPTGAGGGDTPPGTSAEVFARVLPLTVGGREVWVSIHAVAFDGGTVYAFRDMTVERRLEQVRADMIATVSHELRTPLASVYGAARTLQRPEIDDDTRAVLVEMVATECERLNRIVDEFLLASSLERQVDLAREPVDVTALLRDLVVVAGARTPDRFEVRLEEPDARVFAEGDSERLRQVLTNLVDNALKYGASGGRLDLAAGVVAGGVQVRVRDFGPGIPLAEQRHIFERFYRLDPQLSSGVSGTGLGLYISRELVTRMRGRLLLESAPGEGTTFTIELPRAAVPAPL